jgi:4a-hydroxytetrahydrobiopterin dehydratase
MANRLDPQQADAALSKVQGWTLAGDQISRKLVFADFVDAMIFVNKVAEIAEEEGHHPEINIVYNRVTLTLTTHDAGGLTAKDFQVARRIDELGTQYRAA